MENLDRNEWATCPSRFTRFTFKSKIDLGGKIEF